MITAAALAQLIADVSEPLTRIDALIAQCREWSAAGCPGIDPGRVSVSGGGHGSPVEAQAMRGPDVWANREQRLRELRQPILSGLYPWVDWISGERRSASHIVQFWRAGADPNDDTWCEPTAEVLLSALSAWVLYARELIRLAEMIDERHHEIDRAESNRLEDENRSTGTCKWCGHYCRGRSAVPRDERVRIIPINEGNRDIIGICRRCDAVHRRRCKRDGEHRRDLTALDATARQIERGTLDPADIPWDDLQEDTPNE